MTTLFIEPSDVWLFRDGRPFSAGSDRRARSVFPPFPTVTAGVLRTAYLQSQDRVSLAAYAGLDKNSDDPIVKAIGSSAEGDYGNLRLRGPVLASLDDGKLTRYYPAPADLYVKKSLKTGNVESYHLPKVVPANGNTANWPLDTLGAQMLWLAERNTDEYKVENAEGWLAEAELNKYLRSDLGDIALTKNKDLFDYENRLGIALQPGGKTTVEGMLYTVDFIRTNWPEHRLGLCLEVLADDGGADITSAWAREGVISIGGERRAGIYCKLNKQGDSMYQPKQRRKLRVYFTTPAYFQEGWQPDWTHYFSGNPKLIAAAVNTPLTMAGFDMATNQHKPARRFVPAGSVYYLEGEEDIGLKEKDGDGKPIYGISDFGAQIGFGQVRIGEWQ